MTSLRLTFLTAQGKKTSITVPNPKASLTTQQVKAAMEDIVDADIFRPSFVEPVSATIIDNNNVVLYKAS